jgi:hypothetical protein
MNGQTTTQDEINRDGRDYPDWQFGDIVIGDDYTVIFLGFTGHWYARGAGAHFAGIDVDSAEASLTWNASAFDKKGT